MSKSTLQQAVNQIADRLSNSKAIRESVIDKRPQQIDFKRSEIIKTIHTEFGKRKLPLLNVDALVTKFLKNVYNNFKGKSGFNYRISGTPNNFSIFSTQRNKTDGSVFKLGLRQTLNPFVKKLEEELADLVGVSRESLARGYHVPSKKDPTKTSPTRGFLHQGHVRAVSEIGSQATVTSDIKKILTENYSENLNVFLTKNGFFDKPRKFVQLKLESQAENSASIVKGEAGVLKALARELIELDLANIKGSPSINEEIQDSLIAAATGKKSRKNTSSTSAKSQVSVKAKRDRSRFTLETEIAKAKPKDWLSLLPIINSRLPSTVMKNMGAPGLVNRTGTFANSAKVTSITTTPQGFPSLGITYDKTPYGVFDRTNGASPWNTPARDPHTLIEKSLREIATDFIKERFYVTRQ